MGVDSRSSVLLPRKFKRPGVTRIFALPKLALRATARARRGRYVALEGRPGGPFVVRPAPPWADSDEGRVTFRFCGDDGGAMSDAPDGRVWIAHGLNDRWRPLELDDDPAFAPLRGGSTTSDDRIYCDALGWRRGGREESVVGWGRPAPTRFGAVVAARRPPLARRRRALDEALRADLERRPAARERRLDRGVELRTHDPLDDPPQPSATGQALPGLRPRPSGAGRC